jgi:hypothetical protein
MLFDAESGFEGGVVLQEKLLSAQCRNLPKRNAKHCGFSERTLSELYGI